MSVVWTLLAIAALAGGLVVVLRREGARLERQRRVRTVMVHIGVDTAAFEEAMRRAQRALERTRAAAEKAGRELAEAMREANR